LRAGRSAVDQDELHVPPPSEKQNTSCGGWRCCAAASGDDKDEADRETGRSHVSPSSSGTAAARATIAQVANGDRQ
jgi:hypothetical protein